MHGQTSNNLQDFNPHNSSDKKTEHGAIAEYQNFIRALAFEK